MPAFLNITIPKDRTISMIILSGIFTISSPAIQHKLLRLIYCSSSSTMASPQSFPVIPSLMSILRGVDTTVITIPVSTLHPTMVKESIRSLLYKMSPTTMAPAILTRLYDHSHDGHAATMKFMMVPDIAPPTGPKTIATRNVPMESRNNGR